MGSKLGSAPSRRQPSIVFLNRFYWPDVAATAQMLTDLAEDLAEAGLDVTVVASRAAYADGARKLPAEESRRGVRIRRVWTTRFGRGTILGRAVDHMTFLVGCLIRTLRIPRPNAIVAMTDPPLLVGAAVVAGAIRRVPVVYWLQDLFPQVAIRLGVLPRIVGNAVEILARLWNRSCDAVITLGPAMTNAAVAAGAQKDRVMHVHNWADAEAIKPVSKDRNAFVAEHGLKDCFVVQYSGNAGRAHVFEAVIEAAKRLQDVPEVLFLFIGGGNKFPKVRHKVDAFGVGNVRFMDYVPRDRLAESLSVADVSLVTEDPAVVGCLVPSKTYGIMASGRPLLFVGSESSDVAALVRKHRCGLVVSPDDPDALVAAIQHLRSHAETARVMGARGREAAVRLYDRKVATRRWRETVERLLGWTDEEQETDTALDGVTVARE